jgi:hypothetical protein
MSADASEPILNWETHVVLSILKKQSPMYSRQPTVTLAGLLIRPSAIKSPRKKYQ